ncbi:nucleotidyltransferase domain-containing protein [Pseudoxanthomonas suwonensis]|uniref:nucleotidyltransferase domain-containing protein n=1 Tax=Pseudoxanthomonas suwonensis TaxID=314722 RepID=UPI0004BAFE87|nr:nucleotidyltransferase domain-containing protein [Pseudoxanthomonas suwonensis]
MDLLFGGARQRVLAALLLEPDQGFHLRELARRTGSHAGTLARELDKLAATGLLARSQQGNQVRYQADRSHPLFDDLAAMFRKTHGVAASLREALAPLAGKIRLALLFGSMARGTQSAGSDIDLLVVGTAGFADVVKMLYPLQQALQREINPVLYSPEEFAMRVREGGAFARQLLDPSNVLLTGDRDDLAELAGDQAPPGPRH